MEPIVNRVAESDIIVFNLEEYWDNEPVDEIDLAPFLFRGLVLREKDFREQVKSYDWEQHRGHHVAIFCSTDAIVPVWAYMLMATRLQNVATTVAMGRKEELVRDHFMRRLSAETWDRFVDRIVVIKGCGSKIVPHSAYIQATLQLQKVASKLMYGEPCSSVPLWRKPSASRQGGSSVAAKPVSLPRRTDDDLAPDVRT
jgi:hypothetical protein